MQKKWIVLPLALMLLVPLALARPDLDGDGVADRSWHGPCTAYEHAHGSAAEGNETNPEFVALADEAAAGNLSVEDYCATVEHPGRGFMRSADARAAAEERTGRTTGADAADEHRPDDAGAPEDAGARPDAAGQPEDPGQPDEPGSQGRGRP